MPAIAFAADETATTEELASESLDFGEEKDTPENEVSERKKKPSTQKKKNQ